MSVVAFRRFKELWPPCSVPRILNVVCNKYDVTREGLIAPRKGPYLTRARHVAMWLADRTTTLGWTDIGRLVGCRDHSTVIYGVRKVRLLREMDAGFSAELDDLEAQVRA